MRVLAGCLLLACSSSAPAPIHNAPPPPVATAPPAKAIGTLRGTVTDAKTHEAIIGATVVATHGDKEQHTVITDEHGQFTLELAPQKYAVAYYYLDQQTVRTVEISAGATMVLDGQLDMSASSP